MNLSKDNPELDLRLQNIQTLFETMAHEDNMLPELRPYFQNLFAIMKETRQGLNGGNFAQYYIEEKVQAFITSCKYLSNRLEREN